MKKENEKLKNYFKYSSIKYNINEKMIENDYLIKNIINEIYLYKNEYKTIKLLYLIWWSQLNNIFYWNILSQNCIDFLIYEKLLYKWAWDDLKKVKKILLTLLLEIEKSLKNINNNFIINNKEQIVNDIIKTKHTKIKIKYNSIIDNLEENIFLNFNLENKFLKTKEEWQIKDFILFDDNSYYNIFLFKEKAEIPLIPISENLTILISELINKKDIKKLYLIYSIINKEKDIENIISNNWFKKVLNLHLNNTQNNNIKISFKKSEIKNLLYNNLIHLLYKKNNFNYKNAINTLNLINNILKDL